MYPLFREIVFSYFSGRTLVRGFGLLCAFFFVLRCLFFSHMSISLFSHVQLIRTCMSFLAHFGVLIGAFWVCSRPWVSTLWSISLHASYFDFRCTCWLFHTLLFWAYGYMFLHILCFVFLCTCVPVFCFPRFMSGCARGSSLCLDFRSRPIWVHLWCTLLVGVLGCLCWCDLAFRCAQCWIVELSGMGCGDAMCIQGGARILAVFSHCGFRWHLFLGCPGIFLLSAFCLWAGLSSCW